MRSLLLLLLVSSSLTLAAQAPAKPASPPARGAEAPENYSYDPGGRRDPFLNLVGSSTDSRAGKRAADGTVGLSVNEITVRGILQNRGVLVAMVQGPDNKTYLVRQGDRFADGTIKTITPQALIIVQEINDPLSLVKQREIRKQLRSLEDGKQ